MSKRPTRAPVAPGTRSAPRRHFMEWRRVRRVLRAAGRLRPGARRGLRRAHGNSDLAHDVRRPARGVCCRRRGRPRRRRTRGRHALCHVGFGVAPSVAAWLHHNVAQTVVALAAPAPGLCADFGELGELELLREAPPSQKRPRVLPERARGCGECGVSCTVRRRLRGSEQRARPHLEQNGALLRQGREFIQKQRVAALAAAARRRATGYRLGQVRTARRPRRALRQLRRA